MYTPVHLCSTVLKCLKFKVCNCIIINPLSYFLRFHFPWCAHVCPSRKFTFLYCRYEINSPIDEYDLESVCIFCPKPALERQQKEQENQTQWHISEKLFFFIHHAFYTQYLNALFRTSCFIHSREKVRNHKMVWEGLKKAGMEQREGGWHIHSELHSISNLQCCTHKCRAVGTMLHWPLLFYMHDILHQFRRFY